jgi:adenylate kinase
LYKKPYFFPIFGALRYGGPGTKWELYKRFGKMATEEYALMRVYEDGEPGSAEITDVILNRKKA